MVGARPGWPITTATRWYDPSGALYATTSSTVTSTTWLVTRSPSLTVAGTAAETKLGRWYADIYQNDVLIARRTFVLRAP